MILKSPRAQGVLMLLITAMSWGFNWPVLKFIMGEWPPFLFRMLTGAGGVSLLVAIALLRGDRFTIPRGQLWRVAIAAILNITSWMGLATLSLYWLAASEAAIIAYTMPVWASILAWPFLGERPSAPRIAGLILGMSGVATLMAGQLTSAPAADLIAKLPGVACILGTALMFAGGAVFSKRYPVAMAPVPLLAWQLAIGMTPMFAASLAFEHWTLARVTPLGWAALAYVAVIALCVSYLAWFRALKLLPASTAAIGTLLVPVIGVFSSSLALGEPLGARQLIALSLTVGGVLLASRG